MGVRNSITLGFAVAPEDRPRLDHLSDVFAGGNRSELLRHAIDLLERLESAQALASLQAYGQRRLEESGLTRADIPALVEAAIANPDPIAMAETKLIIAGLPEKRWISRDGDAGQAPSDVDLLFRKLVDETAPEASAK